MSRALIGTLEFVGECVLLFGNSLRQIVRRPFEWGELFTQMAFIGIASVPIVALTCFFSGAVLALYTSEVLLRYGASSLAGATVGLSVAREVGPVLAGIMVVARCGSAMAAQIGSMAVTEQIDALRALSVSPIRYLVVPRLLASMTMLPFLAVVGFYGGIAGGYAVAVGLGNIPSGTFLQSMTQFMTPWDLLGGMIKTVVFGIILAIVACQQGLRATGGAVGVGRATTRSVVISMVLIYVANFFLADLLF